MFTFFSSKVLACSLLSDIHVRSQSFFFLFRDLMFSEHEITIFFFGSEKVEIFCEISILNVSDLIAKKAKICISS